MEIPRINIGEQFTIVDLNPLKIPRKTCEEPVVVQLHPKAMRATVTRVQDRLDDGWQRVFMQAEATRHKLGNSYEMYTKRRLGDGIYTNRSGVYLFFHELVAPDSARQFLGHLAELNPEMANVDMSRFFVEQLGTRGLVGGRMR